MRQSFELQFQQILDSAPQILGAITMLVVLVIIGRILSNTALAEHNFTFSSNVTSAIDMLPVNVKLDSDKS